MVKSKKMSKTSIAIIVLALLLTLSLVMGITGAWFTHNSNASTNTVELKFGTVDFELRLQTTVAKQGKFVGSNGSGTYYLVAGSEIETGVTLTNNSNIDTCYILVGPDGENYVIDANNGNLLLVDSDAESRDYNLMAMLLHEGDDVKFKLKYTVVDEANHETEGSDIFTYQVYNFSNETYGQPLELGYGEGADRGRAWTMKGIERVEVFAGTASQYASRGFKVGDMKLTGEDEQGGAEYHTITAEDLEQGGTYVNSKPGAGDIIFVETEHDELVFDDTVDLGAMLLSGTYELRAVQFTNIPGQDQNEKLLNAYMLLTMLWNNEAPAFPVNP